MCVCVCGLGGGGGGHVFIFLMGPNIFFKIGIRDSFGLWLKMFLKIIFFGNYAKRKSS